MLSTLELWGSQIVEFINDLLHKFGLTLRELGTPTVMVMILAGFYTTAATVIGYELQSKLKGPAGGPVPSFGKRIGIVFSTTGVFFVFFAIVLVLIQGIFISHGITLGEAVMKAELCGVAGFLQAMMVVVLVAISSTTNRFTKYFWLVIRIVLTVVFLAIGFVVYGGVLKL